MAGNDCIGLNGGVAMMNLIERTAQACPNTKIIVSGYSQGAMVAHNGVAFARAEAKRQVAVSPLRVSLPPFQFFLYFLSKRSS
jgi:predicted esterase